MNLNNKMSLFYIFGLILILYLVVTLGLYIFQRKLLYYPNFNSHLTGEGLIHSFENINIKTKDNINLKGWFHKKSINNKKTLIFFHGNAGDLRNRIYKLNLIKDFDINFLIVAYRGFSGNKGKPTEAGLYEDAAV